MWQILHASFCKFSKLPNSGISLNWSIIDELTTRNTTAYFLAHSVQAIAFTESENNVCLNTFHTYVDKTQLSYQENRCAAAVYNNNDNDDDDDDVGDDMFNDTYHRGSTGQNIYICCQQPLHITNMATANFVVITNGGGARSLEQPISTNSVPRAFFPRVAIGCRLLGGVLIGGYMR